MKDASIKLKESLAHCFNTQVDNKSNKPFISKGDKMMSKKLFLKKFVSRHFQYGMTMEGVLYPAEDLKTKMLYTIDPNHLTLLFGIKLDDYDELVKQKISLDWPSRHYGSKRVHFLCPVCGKKVMVLHNSVAAYVCRECDKAANKGRTGDWKKQSPLFTILH